ncbi:trk system potassium uptake protein TrkH [Anaerobranca californiensis DSM 14826]|jgi:trk system potassium uptake protein TrkH|uniref:Trk system potassium uptake protein TrkH n=1 Tax=Anaerobranca californiensis DSM 14826 TaxID=1120989 RepID=A0A1M6PSV0_9FIRM|nr:TrkH family potassium uptake protein [Anaerobranca californiensis]SHK11039.1 trk system potassium uptake protein TrkH [Anaerobranca californiensis DSM 14826]
MIKDKKALTPARILVGGFLSLILIGTILLSLPISSVEGSIGIIDALFTATSAVCVTGLVVVDTGTHFTLFGQLVILGLIQAGGLGFMTMATLIFLLLGKKITLKERLVIQEALNQFSLEGLVRLTKYILIFTISIELIAALFLGLRFSVDYGYKLGMYMGLFHSISAFANAGFDIMGIVGQSSLMAYQNDPVVVFIIMALFVLGGLGFTVIVDIYKRHSFGKMALHSRFALVLTGILLLIGFLGVFLLEYNNPDTLGEMPFYKKILPSIFTGATTRTAGFNTVDTGSLRPATLFFMSVLMFIGASPASTGGGIKTTTFGVLLVSVVAMIKGDREVHIFNRRLPFEIVLKALSIIMISLVIIGLATIILSRTEQQEFLNIFFEVVSAFGTVGLSTGITSELTTVGRIIIIVIMFTGRVGPLTLALAFSQRMKSSNIRYPEEKVLVG